MACLKYCLCMLVAVVIPVGGHGPMPVFGEENEREITLKEVQTIIDRMKEGSRSRWVRG